MDSDNFQLFNGHDCMIINENNISIGKGCFIFNIKNVKKNIQDVLIDVTTEIKTTNSNKRYEIKIQNLYTKLKDGEDYFEELKIDKMVWKNDDNRLIGELSEEVISKSNIEQITSEDYEVFKNLSFACNWSDIRIPAEGVGKTKPDAFEDLVQDLLLESFDIENYSRIGKGADRGRDGQFEKNISGWLPKVTINTKWIVQCKYSENYNNLDQNEIFNELVKVLIHKIDYYMIVTNRKLTQDFKDWFYSEGVQNHCNFPFKKILIQKEQLESILSQEKFSNIRNKYF